MDIKSRCSIVDWSSDVMLGWISTCPEMKKGVCIEGEARLTNAQSKQAIEEGLTTPVFGQRQPPHSTRELESTLQDLNETLGALTSAKAKPASITLVIAAALFSSQSSSSNQSEHITSRFRLIVAKGLIFGTLIPVEIIGSRIAERKLTESGNINESIYRDLLASAYDDGIITDMERNLLKSSARQLGINATTAKRIEHEVKQEREP